jgi:hypothetical protein
MMTSENDASENEPPFLGLPTAAIGSVGLLVVIAGLGVFFMYDGVHGLMGGLGTSFLIKEIVKGLVVWGLGAYVLVSRKVPAMFSARARIRDRPGDVVWVFEKVIHRGGAVRHELMFGFVDGLLVGWSLPASLAEQPTVRAWIERHLPHVTTGHTSELAQRFSVTPGELRH